MPSSAHPQGLSLAPGYHSVNPYFLVRGVDGFIEFLTAVFDGREETKLEESRDVVYDGDHGQRVVRS
jgi:hypothetical protein